MKKTSKKDREIASLRSFLNTLRYDLWGSEDPADIIELIEEITNRLGETIPNGASPCMGECPLHFLKEV